MARRQRISSETSVVVEDDMSSYLAGLGVLGRDKAASSEFVVNEMLPMELEAAYRSNWIARKVVEIPAKDACRQWRDWKASPQQIEKLEEAERKLRVKQKIRQCLIWARLYGGAGLVIGTDDESAYEEPLELKRVKRDSLKFLLPLPRHKLGSTGQLILDVTSEWYGQPSYYEFTTTPPGEEFTSAATKQVKIHPSRVVRFCGPSMPDPLLSSGGWGQSVLMAIDTAIRQATATPGAIAQLIMEANVDVLKMPKVSEMLSSEAGSQKLAKLSAKLNASKSIWNMMTLDSGVEWERHTVNFNGMPDALRIFLLIVCGAADIPATRFLGQSPVGLDSTGESDTRNYNDKIKGDQEDDMTPAMDTLDNVLIRTALGSKPDSVWYEWANLWQMNQVEKSTVLSNHAKAISLISAAGLIQTPALATGFQNAMIELGVYPGLDQAIKEAEQAGDFVEDPPPEPTPQEQQQLAIAQEKQMRQLPPDRGQMALKQLPPPKRVGDAYNPAQRRDPTGQWGLGRRAKQYKNDLQRRIERLEAKLAQLGLGDEDGFEDSGEAGGTAIGTEDDASDAGGTEGGDRGSEE